MAEVVFPKNKGTKQLFKNPILERLSRTHIAVPITIFFLYGAALLYWNIVHTNLSAINTVALFIAGFISFTWVEYMVHRHIFHMKTYTKFREKFQYTVHG